MGVDTGGVGREVLLKSAEWIVNGQSSVALAMRCRATSQYSGDMSMPTACLPNPSAATQVVPLPENGSSTDPPGGHRRRTKNCGNARGRAAGCLLFLDSGQRRRTLSGSTILTPMAHVRRMPNPLPFSELSLPASRSPARAVCSPLARHGGTSPWGEPRCRMRALPLG